MTILAAITSARATRAQGAFAQDAAEANAAFARLQAKDALTRGESAATDRATQTRQTIGAQRASFGAQGISLEEGSALDVQLAEAEIGAVDVQRIRNTAAKASFGFEAQAADFLTQGTLARMASENVAADTLLTAGLAVFRDVAAFQVPERKSTGPSTQVLARATARQRQQFNTRSPFGVPGSR
jgi:hypothetical protein